MVNVWDDTAVSGFAEKKVYASKRAPSSNGAFS
jgi:hypothetical protein